MLDDKRAWFTALGGGRVNQYGMLGFLARLANPYSKVRANLKAPDNEVHKNNMKGEGFITGGLYVVPRGGPPAEYAFLEREIGDQFDVDEVVKAAQRAGGRTS